MPKQTPARRKSGAQRRTDWQQTFLAEIEKNVVIGLACKRVGIASSTFRLERQRDEAFAVAYAEAHERGLDTLEAVVRMRATSGQPIRKTVTKKNGDGEVIEVTETEDLLISTNAAMFLLKRYRPEFRDSYRVEQTGAGGGPIQYQHKVEGSYDELADELDRLAASD